ncbi:hypothetical protein BaRGS_00004634 [Batillaria attramentaria]|uniref:Uncharacterized protein n=1 Tax=Batillaria attramentaria TaxID=370345 RepID=A0ABD0LYR2_9CAEN
MGVAGTVRWRGTVSTETGTTSDVREPMSCLFSSKIRRVFELPLTTQSFLVVVPARQYYDDRVPCLCNISHQPATACTPAVRAVSVASSIHTIYLSWLEWRVLFTQ